MDELRQTYLDEANELLASLEKSLLSLEQNPENREIIEEVFRVMHTLKGNSSMFGYPLIAELVHDLETIYDQIRQNIISLSPAILNCTLAALDHLRAIIHDTDLLDAQNKGRHEILRKDITGLLSQNGTTGNTTAQVKVAETKAKLFHIYFAPDAAFFRNGANPLLLLTELSQMGTMKAVPFMKAGADTEDADLETCFTAWDILLETTAKHSALEEVFVFVDQASQLEIALLSEEGFKNNSAINELVEQALSLDIRLDVEKLKTVVLPKETEQLSAAPIPAAAEAVREAKAKTEKAASTIRVASDKLNELMNLVSELVTTQAGLSLYVTNNKLADLEGITENVEKLSRRLRDIAFGMTLVPINQMFGRFQRMVRDISGKLGKEVEFVTEGGETELDKTIIETLTDPLMHILRNSLDHGLEVPEERLQKGKSATGTVRLKAYYSGVHVYIQISDDGKGLDKDAILQKAKEKGLVKENELLSEKEIFDLVFKPGFSTAKAITDVSGRGVGMDVVKRNITNLKGVITLDSKLNEGTTLTIRLPLTLSIIDGLLVSIAETSYIIPLSVITKCYAVKNNMLVGQFNDLIELDNRQVPFLHLREQFGESNNVEGSSQMIVVSNGDREVGVSVDQIIGEYQAVVKPLGKYYRNQDFASGASILGDGTIALILDTTKLIELHEKQVNLKTSIEHV